MEKCIEVILSGKFEANCLQLLLSKALGYSIIFFSFTIKLPQIKNMMKTKTDQGLSYLATYLEIIIFLLQSLYSYHNKNPISTYGENIIILLQCLIILFLSWKYSEKKGSFFTRASFIIGLVVFSGLCMQDKYIPEIVWKIIGSSSIPLVSLARISQIYHSFRSKDTGPLSQFTFFLGFAGNLARAFTTVTETGDMILLASYLYGALLNFIILIQIVMYGNKAELNKVTPTPEGKQIKKD